MYAELPPAGAAPHAQSPRTPQQTPLLGADVNLFGFTMLMNCCHPCGAGRRSKHVQPKCPSAKLPLGGEGATDPGRVPRHTFRAGAADTLG